MRRVGIIGLGLVGTAIAHRLRLAGYEVLGFDISAPQRQALAAAGSRAAESAAEVVAACDTVVLSLPDSRVVAQLLAELAPQIRAGLLVIDTTTGDPADAETTGAKLAKQGATYLDATIAGSSVQIHDGQAIVMAGGTEEAFAAAREVLSTFAKSVFHVGPWGAGSRMKLVVNLVLGLNRAVLAEGLNFASALGVDPQAALHILRASAAYSQVMDTKGDRMLTENFSPPQARLSQHLKDVRLILENAARTGANVPLSKLHRQLLEQAETLGCGELDNSAIIRAFRQNP
jgi:3-hydroxyisobutyrate dehydrogenase-like beta-hydroxyacid dehydrogenase